MDNTAVAAASKALVNATKKLDRINAGKQKSIDTAVARANKKYAAKVEAATKEVETARTALEGVIKA